MLLISYSLVKLVFWFDIKILREAILMYRKWFLLVVLIFST